MLEEEWKCLVCHDMVCSDTCKGTSELTPISSRCGDNCVRALRQGEGIPPIGMDLAGCLSLLLARRSESCLDPVKEMRQILEAGANQ